MDIRFRHPLLLLAFFLCLAPASADVYHQVEADRESIQLNTTVELSCDPDEESCPVNRWRVTWRMPEDATVEDVTAAEGEVSEYSVREDSLFITTFSEEKISTETLKIEMNISRDAEEIYRGLYKRQISLPGFKNERTSGSVHIEELLSGKTSYGFRTAYGEEHLNFSGNGSVSIRVKFGEGVETKYYEFFVQAPGFSTELPYEVAVGMTGLVQDFQRFPVAAMESEAFERSVAEWSAGEYVGGSIKIRSNLSKKRYLSVLAHETVHGLNDRVLNWDRTQSTYIEEGTGKFVEFLLRKKLKDNGRVRELFGDPVSYRVVRNGTPYRITLPPSGSREKLWNYYQRDREFMKRWNPMDYPEVREFGYAYSELIVRHFIVNGGDMSEIYRRIDPGRKISSAEKKWEIYGKLMDMTPCKYPEREEFRNCIEKINSYNYTLLRANNIQRGRESIDLERINLTEKKEEDREGIQILSDPGNSTKTFTRGFQGFIEGIEVLIDRLLTQLTELMDVISR
ncbi:MAG: hypothetical protein ABEJ36_05115 [Candidatus Nanosalina sp.]